MEKKKICFIAQFPPPIHGLSKAVDTLYNSYLSEEFDFEKVDITNNKKILKNLIKIWKSKADLYYFTISQTKGGNIRDLVILKLLRLQKKKCVIHLHGGYFRKLVDNELPKWQRKFNYTAIKKLAGVVVLGHSLKHVFHGMIDDGKIFVVPNCVDDEFLISDEEFDLKVTSLGDKEVLRVLYLSNFIRSKGYAEVLEMAKIEKERVFTGAKKRLHFDFAGKFFEESERDFFQNFVKENELENFITYHGIVDGDKKKDLLKQCDIFTLLTRYPNEGQPISILEAMGNGMVIVTTNHAGIPDIVQDEKNGIVLTANDICLKNLINQIFSIYQEHGATNMIMTNRKCVKTKYHQAFYLRKIGEIYKSILEVS